MRKRIINILFGVIMTFVFMVPVKASSVNMKITSNKSTVIVGNNVIVTLTISSNEPLGSWVYSLNYDKNKFSYIAGNYSLSETDAGDGKKTKVSYTYTFKAKASGTAKFYLTNYQASLWSGTGYASVNVGTSSVKVMTQAELEATYSKNNYLKTLTIEGHEISFNKDTLEYNIELENDVTAINISATPEDNKSTVVGTGTREVSEGNNKIEIVVTAQNGNTKTYIINALVKELTPVNVKINDKDYSVIRKEGVLEVPQNYEKTSVIINNEEVLAYKNDITKYVLVGLKDSEGNGNYYIYNEGDNSYTLYRELHFNKLNIVIKDYNGKIPDKYKKTVIAINEEEVVAYKLKEASDYALIYGMNTDTGEENLYIYDRVEHTVLRYNDEEANIYKKLANNYFLYLICFVIGLSLGILVITIISILRHKKKNKFKLYS